LKGKSITTAVRGALIVPLSVMDAWRVISRRKPHLVIGVGGYSSGPGVLVAALRRSPALVLEQNTVPGLTNRSLARLVRAPARTVESTKAFFGEKGFVSGSPVRAEFVGASQPTEAHAQQQPSGVQVLVFGGSQGAHAINMAMVEAASQLAAG